MRRSILRFVGGATCVFAGCWPGAIAIGLYQHVIRPGIGAGRNTVTFTQLDAGGLSIAISNDRLLALGCAVAAVVLICGGLFLMFFWPREDRGRSEEAS